MIKNGEITIAESRRVLRRYWWILQLAVIGCGALGLLIAIMLPKHYSAQTLVLVDQPRVPTEYVRPVVSEELNHRLASMQEQILSRTRLQPIIEKFGLYAQDRGRTHIEDLVERLRIFLTYNPLDPMAATNKLTPPYLSTLHTLHNS